MFTEEMLRTRGESLDGQRVVVSGSGNVAIYAIEKARQLGATVLTCSDSTGYVVDEKGIDLDLLKEVKETRRGRVSDYAEARGAHVKYVAGTGVWNVPCDVALPCATRTSCTRRTPSPWSGAASRPSPRAPTCPPPRGRPGPPGGRRGLRPRQGRQRRRRRHLRAGDAAERLRDSWTFEHTEARLGEIMKHIHDSCHTTAEKYGSPGNYVVGANIAGFELVADAMLAQGLI